MKNIKDFTIYYINLDDSVERKKKLINNLNKYDLKSNRVSAINGRRLIEDEYRIKISRLLNVDENKLKPDYWLNRSNFKSLSTDINNILPRVGIFLSIMYAIKTAIENNENGAIFLEDDAIPMKNILDNLLIPNDTDIFYLGGTFQHLEQAKQSQAKQSQAKQSNQTIKIDSTQLKLYGAFAFLIPSNKKLIEIKKVLYSIFNDGVSKDKHNDWRSGAIKLRAQSIDRFFVNWFQKYGNCYVTNLVKFYHPTDEEDVSTINRKKFNYKKHKLTFHYDSSQDIDILKLLPN
jgi:hypothetical protein